MLSATTLTNKLGTYTMWMAIAVLIFSFAFFAGMSTLIILRSREEARKLQSRNRQISFETEHTNQD